MAGTEITPVVAGQQLVPAAPEFEIVELEEGVGHADAGRQVAVADTERAGVYEHVEPEDRAGHVDGGQVAGKEVATTGETAEQLSARQRRRRSQQASRDRERNELVALRNENAQLKQAVVSTDRRVAKVEISAVDAQIATLETEIGRADSIIARAITAANGEDAAQALQIRDTFRDRLLGLKAEKARQVEATREATPAVQQMQHPHGALPPGITPAQVGNFQIFARRHPWYDPAGGDADSLKARAIDKALLEGGSDPNFADHWQELETRIREEMPHLSQRAGNGAEGGAAAVVKRPVGPRLPGNGAGSGGGSGGPVVFHLSAVRKRALEDLGVYGTKDQDKYIRGFIKYDKDHASDTKQ